MKKMMILFVVSFFCLLGGRGECFAQSVIKRTVQVAIGETVYIGFPGELQNKEIYMIMEYKGQPPMPAILIGKVAAYVMYNVGPEDFCIYHFGYMEGGRFVEVLEVTVELHRAANLSVKCYSGITGKVLDLKRKLYILKPEGLNELV